MTTIDEIKYRWVDMQFHVYLSNGLKTRFPTELVCPSINALQRIPTKSQWKIAMINIKKEVIAIIEEEQT